MSSDPQDDTQTGRHTGEAAKFLNKVKLAARQKVTKASNDRSSALAAAHQQAQESLHAARTTTIDVFGQNLKKLYFCVLTQSDTWQWIETDVNGSITNSSLPFGYDALFDDATQRVYYSVANSDPQPTCDLMSARMDGSDAKKLGTRELRNNQEGGIALDEEEGAIFWVGGDGVIRRTDISGSSTSTILNIPSTRRGTPPPCIALDTQRKKIYWASHGLIGVYSYDGSVDKTFFSEDINTQLQKEPVNSLVVDNVHEYLYWVRSGSLCRAGLDGSNEEWFRCDQMIGSMALDTSTRLLYTVARQARFGFNQFLSSRKWQEYRLYRALMDKGQSFEEMIKPLTMSEKEGFSLRLDPNQVWVGRVVIVTKTAAATQRLIVAHLQKNRAAIVATQNLARARQNAIDELKQAHGRVERAHATAADDITANQQKAIQTREDAQAKAQPRHAAAAQQISNANKYDARKRQDAHNEAQSILDAKRQEAERVKQPAQDKLNAARIRQQNS